MKPKVKDYQEAYDEFVNLSEQKMREKGWSENLIKVRLNFQELVRSGKSEQEFKAYFNSKEARETNNEFLFRVKEFFVESGLVNEKKLEDYPTRSDFKGC